MIIFFSMLGVGFLILQDICLWAAIKFNFKNHYRPWKGNYPEVAVFVPARNESLDLADCLWSLEKLDYPEDKIQFILADDNSDDDTSEIIRKWAALRANRIGLFFTKSPERGINGKANALRKMVETTDAEFLLFTDADCQVPQTWIKEMLGAYSSGTGLVIGVTTVKPDSFLGKMQQLDWWFTSGLIKVTSDIGYSLTGMGNNMLIHRKAYEAAGGFEKAMHSVTEDLAISTAIFRQGYKPVHQVSKANMVITKSEKTFASLLRQRKRWMRGALSLPWYWQSLLILQAGFFPCILVLGVNFPIWALMMWGIKVFIQSIFIIAFAKQTETKLPVLSLLLFEFYYLITSWSTIVYYFWPSKIDWKKRKYS